MVDKAARAGMAKAVLGAAAENGSYQKMAQLVLPALVLPPRVLLPATALTGTDLPDLVVAAALVAASLAIRAPLLLRRERAE